LTDDHDTVIDALRRSGYYVGAYRKVHLGENFQKRWNFYGGDDTSFERFFRQRPHDRPFFLWVGFHDPHRPYKPGAFSPPHNAGSIRVPEFLPDTAAVRQDLADYYDAIGRMNLDASQVLTLLDAQGLAQNTIVFFVGDNGMPFPGAKGSLYDAGVKVPLIVRWPGHIKPRQVRAEVVSLVDLAPTWLQVAAIQPLPHLEGRSLLATRTENSERPAFFERNWHDHLDLIRGVRFKRHLLIQNYLPEISYLPTLDLAESPTWIAIQDLHRQRKLSAELERRYFSTSRTQVELYDVEKDPFQLHDLSADPANTEVIRSLQKLLSDWMVSTSDFLPPPILPPLGPQGEPLH
jgi:arylsulfatase A-like enzyme